MAEVVAEGVRPGLAALLNPASVLLVGVSRPGAGKSRVGGYAVLQNLRRGGFTGRISLVHPAGEPIDGMPVVPTIGELPEPHDLAVISLPAARVSGTVAECAAAGIRAFVILSSGFGETGTVEGRRHEAELRELAAAHGLTICGPNSLGMVNLGSGAWVGNFASLESADLVPGGLALVSQSGAIAGSLAARAADRGVGLSHIISTGNETVTTAADVVSALVHDDAVRVISLYLEGAHDGRALVEACRAAREAGKPVVVYKVGETDVGARAAMSHTAKLAGLPALYRGALEQAGAVQAVSLDDLIETPIAFLSWPGPIETPVRRVCVISISGGLGAVTADALVKAGLDVPLLAESTQEGLRALELPLGAMTNPVDTAGATQRRQDVFEQVAKVVAADPSVDAIVVPLASRFRAAAETTTDDLLAAASAAGIPLLVAWYSGSDNAEFVGRLRAAGTVPCFDSIDSCVRALHGWNRVAQPPPRPETGAGSTGRVELDTALTGVLDEADSKALLAEHGLPLPREGRARTPGEARRVAEEIGYPVAVKIVSADVPHKAAAGGVRLGVAGPDELDRAFREILESVRTAVPGADLDGVLVSEMVAPERELLVGVHGDDTFGLVLALGTGGSRVEELADVRFRLLPLGRAEIDALCRSVLGHAQPQVVRDVAEVVASVAAFAWGARERLRELDVNPLVVTTSGAVRALDAVVRLDPERKESG
ncbi:acetate--CoA ligase family protein [Acrocarpospora sp. B8E8]|uniref:acetate--CoA ligase family protein n=1 Tax=Acrocarpospora sp. B8E8 TaxID=3153572 RepID=UPI00325C896E